MALDIPVDPGRVSPWKSHSTEGLYNTISCQYFFPLPIFPSIALANTFTAKGLLFVF